MKDKSNKVILYEFRDLDNIPFYVGITNNYRRRKNEHLHSLRIGCKYPVYNKLRKLQEEGYKLNMIVLQEDLTLDEANELEIKTIKEYKEKGIKLYNLAEGGGGRLGFSVTFTEEWKQKLKEAAKRRANDLSYSNPFRKGIMQIWKENGLSDKEIEERLRLKSEKHSQFAKSENNPFRNLEQTLERRKMLGDRAKKTFTGKNQSKEHKQLRFENSKKTVLNRSEERKKEISNTAKINGAKAHKDLDMVVENIITGIKFDFHGTFKALENYIKENYNNKPLAGSLSYTAKGLYKSTKCGWKVNLISQ